MRKPELVELTVSCALYQDDKILLQESHRKTWAGLCLPGGHVEEGESFVQAIIREMQEETGLTILDPKLCGVKQFPGGIDGSRYIVLLFRAEHYTGTLSDSVEGHNDWYKRSDLPGLPVVDDLLYQLEVMESEEFSEFQQVVENDEWIPKRY